MAKVNKRPTQQSKSGISPFLIIVVVVAAILVVGGLIFLNSQSTAEVDVSRYPYLGDENAPVVIVEYSDYG